MGASANSRATERPALISWGLLYGLAIFHGTNVAKVQLQLLFFKQIKHLAPNADAERRLEEQHYQKE